MIQERVIEPLTKDKIDSKSSDDDDEDTNFNKFYSVPGTSSGSGISGSGSQNQRKEIDDYLSQPRAVSNEDILEWWKRHEFQFPLLAKMARDFLSIPANSIPTEVHFFQKQHRNRLNNESARWLLCIDSWQ
ncbi:unnamed protein product [Psylliodes chrysocephalus]|uniref:HAT C-terminal dimerisation domain-containing protein n=1 Tax=Psylliodes chrysocephalus TaxID=3402493 RepID=A0A9P0G8D8_9CUCU|nr:unnamed protein product [Psylliodes chrysocephala]